MTFEKEQKQSVSYKNYKNMIKRIKLIYKYLDTPDRIKFTIYYTVILGSIIALYFVVFLKILNFFNLLNEGLLKNIARIKFSPSSYIGGIVEASTITFYLGTAAAAKKLLVKSLSKVPDEQLSPTDRRNLYLEKNINKVFKEGIDVLRNDGLMVFLKEDPLEIKRSVFLLALLLVPLYLFYIL